MGVAPGLFRPGFREMLRDGSACSSLHNGKAQRCENCFWRYPCFPLVGMNNIRRQQPTYEKSGNARKFSDVQGGSSEQQVIPPYSFMVTGSQAGEIIDLPPNGKYQDSHCNRQTRSHV